ncbi:unnamed protein product [Gadus morhua 'NCC']
MLYPADRTESGSVPCEPSCIQHRPHPTQTTSSTDHLPYRPHPVQTTSDHLQHRPHPVQTTSDHLQYRPPPVQTTSSTDHLQYRPHQTTSSTDHIQHRPPPNRPPPVQTTSSTDHLQYRPPPVQTTSSTDHIQHRPIREVRNGRCLSTARHGNRTDGHVHLIAVMCLAWPLFRPSPIPGGDSIRLNAPPTLKIQCSDIITQGSKEQREKAACPVRFAVLDGSRPLAEG